MKLKQLHVRSPLDDEDLSFILVKPELSGNDNLTNNPESMDCLIIPTAHDNLEKSETIQNALLHTTNELTALLSKVQTNESQVIIVNNRSTPPRDQTMIPSSNSMTHITPDRTVSHLQSNPFKDILSFQSQNPEIHHTDSRNLESVLGSQYFFSQGNIVLLNQNTKAKTAEKNVVNILTRKYLRFWYQAYRSHRMHRMRIKKLVVNEWKKVSTASKEGNSMSTETMIDDIRLPPDRNKRTNLNQKLSPGSQAKVLMIDISSEDLNSLPSKLVLSPSAPPITVPSIIEIPVSIPIKPGANNKSNSKAVGQKQKVKEVTTPNGQKYRYHQQPTISSQKKLRSNDTQASNSSTIPSKQGNGKHYLKSKYPNLQLINNYVNQYEEQEKHHPQQPPATTVTKAKKEFKAEDTKLLKQKIKQKATALQNEKHLNSQLIEIVKNDNESVSSLSSVSMMKDKDRPISTITRRLSTHKTPPSKILQDPSLNFEISSEISPRFFNNAADPQYDPLIMNQQPAPEFYSNSLNNSPPTTITNPNTTTPPNSLSGILHKLRQNKPDPNSFQIDRQDSASLCNMEPTREELSPNPSSTQTQPSFGKRLMQKMQKYNMQTGQLPIQVLPLEMNPRVMNFIEKPLDQTANWGRTYQEPSAAMDPAPVIARVDSSDADISPIPNKLSLIKQKIQQQVLFTPFQPVALESPQTNHFPTTLPSQPAFTLQTRSYSPESLNYGNTLQSNFLDRPKVLRKYFKRFISFIKHSIYNWEIEQKSSNYYHFALRRRYFRKFRAETTSLQFSSHPLKSHRKETVRDQHIWGNDRLARKYIIMRWMKFSIPRAQMNEKEDRIIQKIENKKKIQALIQWKSFLLHRKRFKHHLQRKIKNSPKSKYFHPSLQSDENDYDDEESGSLHFSHATKSYFHGSPSQIFATLDSLNEENTLSFHLDDDDEMNSIYLSTSSESEETSIHAEQATLTTPVESENPSVDEIQNYMRAESPISSVSPLQMNEEVLSSQAVIGTVRPVPVFFKKRITSLIHYYQSYRYYQYYQLSQSLRMFLVNAIKRRLKRQMMIMAIKHYCRKLCLSALFLWKERVNASYATSSPTPSTVDDRSWSRSSSLLLDLRSLSDGYESYDSDK